ncbi:hypothetical protein [Cryptosporidium hominis TU502]|uniref:hypothetical protein n=1 Tax=Cryptosporidium hominis (strain TU502) TaxID=353151 RepID=UPI0000452EE5|nr:hypothetical protein [Cryptosporidium hominis TU502]
MRGFVGKRSNQKNQEGDINIGQMIRGSVTDNKIIQASRIVSDDNIKNNVKNSNNDNSGNNRNIPDKNNIINNVESKSSSEKTVINDSVQKLLHFQDILGKGSKIESDYSRKNENITPEAITDVIKNVLSSRQVYNMINTSNELLLRK